MKSTQVCYEVSHQRMRQIAAEAGRLVAALALGEDSVGGGRPPALVGLPGAAGGALSWAGESEDPPESTIWDMF